MRRLEVVGAPAAAADVHREPAVAELHVPAAAGFCRVRAEIAVTLPV